MDEQREFQVGDVVRIVSGIRDDHISAPFTITTKHKGNGNVLVNKAWFKADGYEVRPRGDLSLRRAHLTMDGSPECVRVMRARRQSLAVYELRETVEKLDKQKVDPVKCREVLEILKPMMKENER